MARHYLFECALLKTVFLALWALFLAGQLAGAAPHVFTVFDLTTAF